MLFRSLEVVIVDARSTGQGASDVNAGWFCPAESAPVPGPGIVGKSLKWMLHPDSPLYIKPSLQPTFIKFMLQMWRHCNASDQQSGLEASIQLVGDSAELYKKYQREMKFELHSQGLLSVFLEKKNFESYSKNLEILKRYDLDPQVLLGDHVREYEPLLSDNVYAGVMFPHEMHVDPGSMMAGLTMNISDCTAEHSLGQAIGGLKHVPHGLTIGLVLVETLTREARVVPEKMERIADAMGLPQDGTKDGSRVINKVREILKELNFPVLSSLGFEAKDIDNLADIALKDFFITQAPKPWSKEEVVEAFNSALALTSR